jgi:hypothetical protein
MTNADIPTLPRSIPPQPTVACFLRDLVPDRLWDEFDIGSVRTGEIEKIQKALLKLGGREAWLRFVEKTRATLPQLLSVSLFETLGLALENEQVWPDYITVYCRPVLSIYALGELLPVTVTLHCHARLTFDCIGEPISSGYVRARTVLTLRHARESLMACVPGEYFIPVPLQRNRANVNSARHNWFKGFGRPRIGS